MRLANKTVIVTGAGSGIGAGIAKRFAAEGARVVVNDINAQGGEATVAAITASKGKAVFTRADVTTAAGWQSLIEAAQQNFGGLDGIVNNAGWSHVNRPFMEVTEADFDRCFTVNVKSIYLSAQAALPVFRKQGRGGAIVNIASTAGVRPRPGLTVYNASKGAVVIMSKSMAAEFAPEQVRVNCVNPVFNPDTALSAAFAGGAVTDAMREKFRASIPMGRFSTAEDVANACLYLASDEAAFITGVNIEVDGGRCV
ncbi:MAG: SDR family oxidoreductase [Burkholderiales bacterium]|nr:SDR family oxidoreductase [Burkholderiales bacterium]